MEYYTDTNTLWIVFFGMRYTPIHHTSLREKQEEYYETSDKPYRSVYIKVLDRNNSSN